MGPEELESDWDGDISDIQSTFGSIRGTFFELVKRLVAMCFPLARRQRLAEEKTKLLECIGVELIKRQCAVTDRFIDK